NVPEFERPEEVPVRSAQERAEHDQRDPEHRKSEKENRYLGLALLEREVPVAVWILVDVRNRDEAGDDQSAQDEDREPRIEKHEQQDQAHDRHVVRLGDDKPEVRIERAEDEERQQRTEHAVAEDVRRDFLPLPENDE